MSPKTSPGFTLIEMVVVLAIIGTLALLVGPSVFRNVGDANVIAAKAQIETLALALDSYRLDTGSYPTTKEGLGSLRTRPDSTRRGWRGPSLRKSVPADPWGRPYLYHAPGIRNPDSYDLLTLGRDNKPGGDGEDVDVKSWGEDPKP